MRPLVVLRPEPGARATCDAAREAGLEPLSLPLFKVAPVAWAAPDPAGFDGLLLTSANAVRHAGAELGKVRGLPVYAVGEATAAQARAAGLTIAAVGNAGADDLLAGIEAGLRLLHLCGEQRREPVAAQAITPIAVYRADALARVAGLERIAGAVVAVHSPRAGARLAELAASAGVDISRTAIAAVSSEAARACGSGWQSLDIAAEPSDAAVLALAATLCDKPER